MPLPQRPHVHGNSGASLNSATTHRRGCRSCEHRTMIYIAGVFHIIIEIESVDIGSSAWSHRPVHSISSYLDEGSIDCADTSCCRIPCILAAILRWNCYAGACIILFRIRETSTSRDSCFVPYSVRTAVRHSPSWRARVIHGLCRLPTCIVISRRLWIIQPICRLATFCKNHCRRILDREINRSFCCRGDGRIHPLSLLNQGTDPYDPIDITDQSP